VYATDESVAIRSIADYDALCPKSQGLARGIDGVFSSGSPWVLTSATVDFEAQGVMANDVILLTAPKTAFKGSGELLAVESASGGSVTLRRLGQVAGVGVPPGAGGVVGVTFAVETLFPQIEEASWDMNRRFNIDPAVPSRAPSSLYDVRDLRQATVARVLRDRYTAEAKDGKGDFARKAKLFDDELTDLIGRLRVRWADSAAAGGGVDRGSVYFGMRVIR
jgi:hypothetical protein